MSEICPQCSGEGYEEIGKIPTPCLLCHGDKVVPDGTKPLEGV